ncbi:aspartate/glutamate racemase family protein [Ideonella margarita]|uniref:Aspartate/glutamate racemase family protein n=1 Tax=Ideonella margarita TaxID=2984191 RepID=A0ABU9CB02_9BURK
MRHLLILNPNTTASVTALLQQHGQRAAGTDVLVSTATARFGAPYIACEASYAVAGHAVLDAWAHALMATPRSLQSRPRPSAVLIGCFGDPGLWALRDSSDVPVTGLAEAAFTAAAALGPFAVVTGGARWRPMLERLAGALGLSTQLAGIHTVAPSGAQLAADPDAAVALLAEACREAAARWPVKSIVLGGAGLAGMAARVQARLQADVQADVGVPVIDSVEAGVRHALALPVQSDKASGFVCGWQGVSVDMTAMGPTAPGRP